MKRLPWVRLTVLAAVVAFYVWYCYHLWAHPDWTAREVLIYLFGGGSPDG